MNVSLTGVFIQGEGFHRIGCKEDFAQLLEEKLGRDAADMFDQQMEDRDPAKCCGECDRIYDTQETYETAIKDALDALRHVRPKDSKGVGSLMEAVDTLKEVLT